MKKKAKTVYSCQACGYQSPKWLGKCPGCGQWDSLVEEADETGAYGERSGNAGTVKALTPVPVDAVVCDHEARMITGISEFDRVLGGGLVEGSLVLIGGEPGIGKSTLMLQALDGLCRMGQKVLYVSGEESVRQIKLRSERLQTLSPRLFVVSEIDLERIMATVAAEKPTVLVIDSIQTMYNPELTSAPGSVSQVRESTMKLMVMAKRSGIPVFLIGHVTKDGSIAGPRVMEHMVDTVLYFEGDNSHVFRILRAVKNRFGSTNEIGVFEMKDRGLAQVTNPSAVFLSERPEKAPGSVVTACMEGTRPILVEIQGLASGSNLGTPRRTVLGLDQNRVALLVAVMEKKLGMHLTGLDIFMNVAGGVKVMEPSVDMAIATAIASSFLDRAVPTGVVVLGEIGLTGEVRAISRIEIRAAEIKKMGFTRLVVPKSCVGGLKGMGDMKITGVKNLGEAMEVLF
ncbi:DNA repair protein RadA [Desulfatiferula olefinivorans]